MKNFVVLFLIFFLGLAPNDARKANEAYKNGDYSRAAELYQQAIKTDPDNARLHFNLGNSLAKLGQTEQAQEAYDRFRNLTQNPNDQSLADYNTGRMYSEQGEFEKAAEFFRRSLQRNPDDSDAKHNYEMALNRQQEQEEQEQQQQQDQDQNNDDQEQEQQDQQQDQEQQNDEQQQEQPQQDQPQDQESDTNEIPEPETMNMDEAENILNALEQRERDLLRNMKKDAQDRSSTSDKDW
jgi:Ca-activated chloride channel family protein